MKRYIRSAQEDRKEFCSQAEATVLNALKQAGVTDKTISELFIDVRPAGSGFRVTIQLPARAFHGRKISEFFYRRDFDYIVESIVESREIADLVDRQSELLKPARKPSSTAEAVKEARNTSDPKVLRALAKHNAASVRARVAMNPNTPSDILYELMCDPDVKYKLDVYTVFRNMDPSDLYNYIFDPSAAFRNAATRAFVSRYQYVHDVPLDLLKQLMDYFIEHPGEGTSDYGGVLPDFASIHDLDSSDYQRLFAINDHYIDWRLALNDSVPSSIHEQIIDRYADDPEEDAMIREATKRLQH